MRETKVEGNSDPRAAEYPNELPVDRYQKAMRDFLIATRTQLGVKGATDVAPDLGIDEGDPGACSASSARGSGVAGPPFPGSSSGRFSTLIDMLDARSDAEPRYGKVALSLWARRIDVVEVDTCGGVESADVL